jgi:hypothetical protein
MQDLLDLCKLNLMEEHIADSPAVDRDATLAAIDWKRRQLVTALTNNPPTLAPDAMERHRKDNNSVLKGREVMKAYRVQTRNAGGKKVTDYIQFAETREESEEIANSRFMVDGETVSMCEEVKPQSKFEAALWSMGALIQVETLAQLIKEYGERNEKSGTPTREVHMQAWPVKVVEGRKYINVDVAGSGKYMVTKDSGDIFGIKGYGVIHTGHHFGTLDTLGEWYWGSYRALKLTQPKVHTPAFTFDGTTRITNEY